MIGLAAFTFWWSAAIFVGTLAVITWIVLKHHEKHHRPEAYDDRLSAERMESAREWLIENSD